MDDVEEQVDIQSEIDQLISKSITSVDDAEIEAELNALLGEDLSTLPEVPISEVDLPQVPSDIPNIEEVETRNEQLLAA